MKDLRPGLVIDNSFALLRPIGEGGMGEVWLARDRALGRDVALKIMRPSEGAARALRFAREAQALAALDHPSILPVLHTGEDPATGLRFFATRPVLLAPDDIRRVCDEVLFCPYPHGFTLPETGAGGASPPGEPPGGAGGAAPRPLPLSALLDGGKTLPEAAVLRIARDLAGALAAAHAVGILHRDVKPSNVLFDASGRALLADFGLAKFTRGGGSHAESAESPDGRAPSRPERGSGAAEAPDSISLDESGSRKFLGSPAYAAPEQFRAGAELTPALDWYSFGAVLYEALTGDRPRSLRPPSSYDPSRIVRAWDRFLRDLLEPDPAMRLADPAAITRRLDAIGRAIDPATRRRRLAERAALAAATAAVAAVAIVAARFHAEPGPGVETHAESAEPAEIGSPAGGAGERSETEGVVHAERRASIPLFGGGAEEAKPPPVALVFPAHPMPPRLDSVWQGEDLGPLQLLGTFRLLPIVRFEAEAFSGGDAELLLKVREGDGAWSSWRQDRAAIGRANSAWFEAVETARRAAAATNAVPAARVRLALCLARLAWTYVANADQGSADAPYRAALAAIDPLVESDPARYGPLRAWLLSERAYMECMEGRFRESAADLQEAGLLWARHAPADDPGCEAQRFILTAALGGMLHRAGDTAAALTMTSRAIKALEPFLFPANPARGSGDDIPRSLADLLAGCHYRLGELHRETGARIASVASYRRAAELWRDLFKTYGERYRTDCIQALGTWANLWRMRGVSKRPSRPGMKSAISSRPCSPPTPRSTAPSSPPPSTTSSAPTEPSATRSAPAPSKPKPPRSLSRSAADRRLRRPAALRGSRPRVTAGHRRSRRRDAIDEIGRPRFPDGEKGKSPTWSTLSITSIASTGRGPGESLQEWTAVRGRRDDKTTGDASLVLRECEARFLVVPSVRRLVVLRERRSRERPADAGVAGC